MPASFYSRFDSVGYRLWVSLFVLVMGMAALLTGSVFLLAMSEGERSPWRIAFLLFAPAVAVLTASEILCILKEGRFLFENALRRFAEKHKKGIRIANLWLFLLLAIALVTFLAFRAYAPYEEARNALILLFAAVFDAVVLVAVIKRSRRIWRRRSMVRRGYGM